MRLRDQRFRRHHAEHRNDQQHSQHRGSHQNEERQAGAEQAVVVTRHDFVRDYLTMRRSMGRVDFFMTQDEREAFIARLAAYFAARGVHP